MLTDQEARRLMADMASGGWPGLDLDKQRELREWQSRRNAHEASEKARVVRDALATPAGRRFLDEFLRPRTIEMRRTAAEAQATTADAYLIEAARREGRNSIWWSIQEALAYDAAPGSAPQPSEGEA